VTQVRRDADLGALARAEEVVEPPKRGWLRVVLPLAIVAAFLWVLRGSLVELLRPRVEVTLVRPTPIEGVSDAGTGTDRAAGEPAALAVQAAGWIEPDPFPTFVSALSGGVVAEVLVQESDAVEAGATVARLVPEDAFLARDIARAAVVRAEASVQLAEVRAGIARERFDAALEVTEAAARARARGIGRAADAEQRAATLREGEALVALAESELVVQQELAAAGASGARQVEIAAADLEAARARLAGLRAELALASAMAEEAVAERARAERELELRFTDRLERDSTGAELALARAELAAARADLAEATLRVERTTVVAPAGGVVLERLAADGDALEPGAPVCTLYDPTRLRVRVDVPQGDVEKLFVGQAAEVLSESRGGRPYRGEVLRIVQRADIQKVTLEAQVRVFDADGLLRPDMLTQVRFLSARADGAPVSREGSTGDAPRALGAAQRIAIPANVLDGDTLWVYDPVANVAYERTIERGAPLERNGAEGLVEVRAGLLLTDKVVDGGRAALSARGDAGEGVPVRVVETTATRGTTEQ
jgi:multidrug efflux pump subunit AcrA (membrane-fusion protein)